MRNHTPFLLLQLRPEDEASDNEFEAFKKFGELMHTDIVRARVEYGAVPDISFGDYAGIIIGGGPYNVSDQPEKKTTAQKKVEEKLHTLLDEVVERDFPFLGVCYGIGLLTNHLAGDVSKVCYGEDVGGVTISLTGEGKCDPILTGLPPTFRALCGHKEACQAVAPGATLLATSEACPVQMIRVKQNIYATQFHVELDLAGIIVRIKTYKHHGYFPPEDAELLIERVRAEQVHIPMRILKNFVSHYTQSLN